MQANPQQAYLNNGQFYGNWRPAYNSRSQSTVRAPRLLLQPASHWIPSLKQALCNKHGVACLVQPGSSSPQLRMAWGSPSSVAEVPFSQQATPPSGQRPAQPAQELSQTSTIRNAVNLQKATLRLAPSADDPNKLAVVFSFDASAPCKCGPLPALRVPLLNMSVILESSGFYNQLLCSWPLWGVLGSMHICHSPATFA